MILKFDEFQKKNIASKELDSIRIKNFKKFETKGLPTKKQEHWKSNFKYEEYPKFLLI